MDRIVKTREYIEYHPQFSDMFHETFAVLSWKFIFGSGIVCQFYNTQRSLEIKCQSPTCNIWTIDWRTALQGDIVLVVDAAVHPSTHSSHRHRGPLGVEQSSEADSIEDGIHLAGFDSIRSSSVQTVCLSIYLVFNWFKIIYWLTSMIHFLGSFSFFN